MAKRGLARRWFALLGALALFMSVMSGAVADGTETLGPPSIAIATGSGTASGGIGLEDVQPGSFDVVVPAGATVNQVLLYWNGFGRENTGDDTVTINGNSVTGIRIGGPTNFFSNVWSHTYRADITALGLVGPGTNSLTVGDLNFGRNNNGAGVIAIYDDSSLAEIGLLDGQDLAYDGISPPGFAPPLDTTVPQTFVFAPAADDRIATLTVFAASVRFDEFRPSVIEVRVDGVPTYFDNLLSSNVGPEFDVLELSLDIPAGATSVWVQARSEDRLGTGDNPASFGWLTAGFVVPVPDDGEGCTPGFWRQEHHYDSWTGYSPADSFDAVFGVASSEGWTLGEAVEAKGGDEYALARHAVAALLNASSPDVDYGYSPAEVIALVQAAYASGDFEPAKDLLADENELGCPLD